jgi:hypothetical protein
MKKRPLYVVAIAGFFLGLLVAPAYATSHVTGYWYIFGNSTSCALGQGSVNDSTHKSGASTINRYGCYPNNAAVGVHGGWLVASTRLWRPSNNMWCSQPASAGNLEADPLTSSVTITTPLAVSANCPVTGSYQGLSVHIRRKAAGGEETLSLGTGTFPFF